jgi:hypothetical protein
MVMKKSVKQHAGAAALAGALALTAAVSAFAQGAPDFAQLRPEDGGGAGFPYQYCVPQDENSGLRQPLYC